MVADFTHCSSGCRTGGHATYGECLRSKGIRHGALGGTRPSRTEQKRWDRENEAYRQAVKDGLQPARVSHAAVNAAYEAAEKG